MDEGHDAETQRKNHESPLEGLTFHVSVHDKHRPSTYVTCNFNKEGASFVTCGGRRENVFCASTHTIHYVCEDETNNGTNIRKMYKNKIVQEERHLFRALSSPETI